MLGVALSFGCANLVEASLVVNGSFEPPLTPAAPNAWHDNYPGGSTAITGWTVVGVDTAIVNTNFTSQGITFQAQHGVQWADLAGVTSNSTSSGITQNINTIAGHEYEISFWVGSATDGQFYFPATIDLSINGGARVSYNNPATPNDKLNWRQFIVPFTATGPTTDITFYNGGASNNYNSALDNVVVEAATAAVPEASSLVVWSVVILSSACGLKWGRGRPSAL